MATPRTVSAFTAVIALPMALALLPGCEFAPRVEATADNTRMWESGEKLDADAATAATVAPPPVTHGAISRARTQELNAKLEQILKSTLPVVDKLQSDLDAVVAKLVVPERLATDDPVLHAWGRSQREAYKSTIDLVYVEADRRLQGLYDVAQSEARQQAQQLATPRSPLDAGATGDPALDRAITTFAEVMDGAIGLKELGIRHQASRGDQLELFEVFTSFGAELADGTTDAEAAMNGRLLLFVGGSETLAEPRALLAFRSDANTPAAHSFVQVMRHRVMRGSAVVSDMGWRLAPVPGMPGHPDTEVLERFLLAPHVQPGMNRSSASFDQLRDMRIVVDIQSAVLDADSAVLGGVDWRIEFNVSARGASRCTWGRS